MTQRPALSTITPEDVPVHRLRKLRIGKYARRILQLAPAPDEEPIVVRPAALDRTTRAAHNKAIHDLEAAGFLSSVMVLEWVDVQRPRTEYEWNNVLGEWVERRLVSHREKRRQLAVKLTPLGAAVTRDMKTVAGGD